MKTVVITGGSSGIGLELVKLYNAAGYFVYCLSRTWPGLVFENFEYIKCDVTDFALVAEIAAGIGKVDILVNNAGIGIGGSVENTDIADARHIVDVNLLGVFNVTKVFLPHLRASRGRVINISSVGGCFSLPFQSLYSSTKAAVIAFSAALKNELRPFGIKVMTILPADTATNFQRLKTIDDGVYTENSHRSITKMERDERRGMTPEYVARKIYRYSHRMPYIKTIGSPFVVLLFVVRFLPHWFVSWLIYKLYG